MKRTILLLTLSVAISMTMLLTGCQEQDLSAQDRKAKLLANDNLELKNQLKDKDKDIKAQVKLLSDCKKENASIRGENGEAMIKLLQLLNDATIELDKVNAENTALKKKIKSAHN